MLREVSTIGTLAPIITAPVTAPPRKLRVLYKILALSMFGAIKISASPATSLVIFLSSADFFSKWHCQWQAGRQ